LTEQRTTMSAAEWREFWKARGMAELQLVLWASWDPIGGTPPDEYDALAFRIASLLGSRASRGALVEELGRIRRDELRIEADPERDAYAAEKVADWFEHATRGW
jgi:hypothetical protein